MSLSFYVSGLWAIGLLVLSLGLASLVPARKPSFWRGLLLVGVIAAGARLVPNVILPVGAAADIEAYQLVAERVVQGEDIYSDPATQNRHPYLPFQMYWMAFSHAVAEALQAPFVMVVRLAPITADVLIACLLFAHTYSSPHPHLPLYCGLFYALNPIPVLVSAYHGQFDAIPALFTLIALVSTQKKPHVAGAWLGLGVLSKGWPVLAFPSLMTAIQGWKSKAIFLMTALAVPILAVGVYSLLFASHPLDIANRVLRYNWGVGVWGYTYLVRLLGILVPALESLFAVVVQYGRYLTLAGLGVIWFYKARRLPPQASTLLILVGFLALTHAFSIQYLLWVVPFAILNLDFRWLGRYTLAAFAYMILAYYTLILDLNITRLLPLPQADWFVIMLMGLPVWIVTVAWLGSLLSHRTDRHSLAELA